MLPGSPREIDVAFPPAGAANFTAFYLRRARPHEVYEVVDYDLKNGAPPDLSGQVRLLSGAIGEEAEKLGAGQKAKAAVSSERAFRWDGYPAREAVISIHSLSVTTRFVLAGRRVYHIAMAGDSGKNSAADLKRFFSSFRILNPR